MFEYIFFGMIWMLKRHSCRGTSCYGKSHACL